MLQTSSLQVLLNATQYDFKPQGTVNGTANVGTNNQGPQLGLSLGRGCSACGTLDVVCTIVRRCIWETIKRLLILTAIAAALMLAGRHFTHHAASEKQGFTVFSGLMQGTSRGRAG